MTAIVTRAGDAHFRLMWWTTNLKQYKDRLMYVEPKSPMVWKLLEIQSGKKFICYFSSRRLMR